MHDGVVGTLFAKMRRSKKSTPGILDPGGLCFITGAPISYRNLIFEIVNLYLSNDINYILNISLAIANSRSGNREISNNPRKACRSRKAWAWSIWIVGASRYLWADDH